ncbi:MAG TPA: hypothetical protein VK633_08435 [Verrucomicrobiae bacterium]|nr:hypothetical protein [Verrucomicrobiae bacterium]
MAEKVGDLVSLLDLFEKDFDLPAAAVEISDGLGTPEQLVAVLLRSPPPGHHSAHQFRCEFFGILQQGLLFFFHSRATAEKEKWLD